MKKIFFVILSTICLSIILCSCMQKQPNFEKFLPDAQQELIQVEPEETITKSSDVIVEPYENMTYHEDNVLEVDYFGVGEVTYLVKTIELTNCLPAGENLANDSITDYLLITIEVTNENVPIETYYAEHALINCFFLYSDALYGIEPIYFSDAYEIAETEPDVKSYFEYKLPNIGESKSVVVGWQMDSNMMQILKENKLYLLYTLSEQLMPIYYG